MTNTSKQTQNAIAELEGARPLESRRGRPKGSGVIDDNETLQRAARMMVDRSGLTFTAAIRGLGKTGSSEQRRLLIKWKRQKETLLQEARNEMETDLKNTTLGAFFREHFGVDEIVENLSIAPGVKQIFKFIAQEARAYQTVKHQSLLRVDQMQSELSQGERIVRMITDFERRDRARDLDIETDKLERSEMSEGDRHYLRALVYYQMAKAAWAEEQ